MFRIAALIAIAAVVFVPAASAGVTCQTSAAAEIAGAAVNGPRAGWDPPVWTFDMPDLNSSVDVQAYTRDDAASKAQAWLQGQVDGACAAAQPAPTTTDTSAATTTPTASAPTPEQTSAAQTTVAAATVTYVGNSWGPTPLWRVDIPTMKLSIDVAANSADEARANVVALVAARLAPALTTTATVPVTTAATTTPQTAPVTVAPVTTAGVTTTPIEVARLLTPTLDPGIRAMLLSATG